MLTSIKVEDLRNPNGSFAIVASEYNERYVGGMVKAAIAELKRADHQVMPEAAHQSQAGEQQCIQDGAGHYEDERHHQAHADRAEQGGEDDTGRGTVGTADETRGDLIQRVGE